MAWYALYKWFSSFRKTPCINQINVYRHHLFNKWYSNLTKEQKERYKRNKERKEQEDLKRFEELLHLTEYILDQNRMYGFRGRVT